MRTSTRNRLQLLLSVAATGACLAAGYYVPKGSGFSFFIAGMNATATLLVLLRGGFRSRT